MRVGRQCAWRALFISVVSIVMVSAAEAQQAPAVSGEMRRALAWQIALEREGFSPGLIDGKPGRKTMMAMVEYQRASALPATGKLDEAARAGLRLDEAGALALYVVQPSDVASVAPPPKTWMEKSKVRRLGYESLADCVAERFHCSEALLAALNPHLRMGKLEVGDRVIVPAVQEPKALYAERLEIDLSEKTVRAFDAGGALTALFHCSIAKEAAKRPRGEARITGVIDNPSYSFDPAMWPEVKDVKQRLLIPPGPRNPVGLCWMALSLPGYGIHGTPNPEMIGKTGSHGCFRLTNWDAVRLGRMVSAGTVVKFVNGAPGTRVAGTD